MNVNEFVTFAKDFITEHGKGDWKIAIDNAVGRNGMCSYSTKTLSFSRHFIENNAQAMVLDVLIHELGHSFTPGADHGPRWAAKCKELGLANPTRCTASEMPKGQYQAKCVVCGPINAFRHRLTGKSPRQRHTACGNSVKWEKLTNV